MNKEGHKLNEKIYTILDDMRLCVGKDKIPIADCDKQIYLSIKSSELLVLLAEENEKSAKKIEKLTKTLTTLTWVIVALTAFLVLSVFFELRNK
ncbi:MAG: hypothetical protein HYR78_04370 [Nitrospirae bacterium]|nr:hypothetical protein [Nitrospirota bacterium]